MLFIPVVCCNDTLSSSKDYRSTDRCTSFPKSSDVSLKMFIKVSQ